jgi:DNA helicase-2/ATP-dependent DNA helicase PcrA
MASTPEFEKAYKGLNAQQKEAVDTIYGPVMVIAGPGTGKTQILAVRIANILQQAQGSKPDEILALTFTESATASLRRRLVSLIGAPAYRVRINTFHGFARFILEKRPDTFPRVSYGTQLSDVSGIALMERLLDAGAYTKIKTPKNPYRTAKELLSFMGELKSEYYTPQSYTKELTQAHQAILEDPERFHTKGKYEGQEKGEHLRLRERLEKHLEVADIYRAYEEALEAEQLYDYQDLIHEAIRGLESDESLRFEIGEHSQFVLADEHQDANPAQNRLLELVTDFDGAPNLFIVGDEKQAIYRFQGATLASFLYFKEKYPEARVISLVKNYRSTHEILSAAHDLIAPAPTPDATFRENLESIVGSGVRVRLASRGTPREEQQAILSYIMQLHKKDVAYEDIAILTRKNADVLSLAMLLRSAGVPEDHASADVDALSHPAVQVFMSLIRFCVDTRRDSDLARALFIPGFPASIMERMRLLALSRQGKSLVAILEEQGSVEVKAWLRTVLHIAGELHSTQAVLWLSRLASESLFLPGILALAESTDAYEAYVGFMDEVALLATQNLKATAADVVQHIALIETHDLSVKRARTKRSGVGVMTAHRAKGMEFPYVIIAHATDEKWMRGQRAEFSLRIEKEDDEHDIRRLFYVALTRAKHEVLITYAQENEEARTLTPLRFLSDITEHLEEVASEDTASVIAPYVSRPVLDSEFLKERLLAQGFSPTGFNNYVASPWQYFFRTLLRIPEQPSPALSFGTAVHAGLKHYADSSKSTNADIKAAVEAFNRELIRLPIPEKDRPALLEKGRLSIETYLKTYGPEMHHVRESEMAVSVPLEVPGVGEITLSGKLDRLDVLADGSVVVVDYKTGASKSENDIRGFTQSGNGDYYRQLVFYKLLLEKDGRYNMTRGALHFVEPDEKGKCIVREFIITDEEVQSFEKELITAAQAIADGSAFANFDCDSTTGDYCDLVQLLGKGDTGSS